MSDALKIEINGPVAVVTLNQPDKLNTMDKGFFAEVGDSFRALDENMSVRVVVLAAEGKHFTAGLDLKGAPELLGMSEEDPGRVRARLNRKIAWIQEQFNAIEFCHQPVIAAIHGACIGGGVDLIAACDIRLATQDAWFSIKEIDVGIVADLGTLQRAASLMPGGILRELAYTGRKCTATEALSHGFINASYADKAALMEAATAMATTIAAKSPLAMAGTKRIINHARDNTVRDGLDYVATWNSAQLFGDDLMRAATASMTKQNPTFDDLLDDE